MGFRGTNVYIRVLGMDPFLGLPDSSNTGSHSGNLNRGSLVVTHSCLISLFKLEWCSLWDLDGWYRTAMNCLAASFASSRVSVINFRKLVSKDKFGWGSGSDDFYFFLISFITDFPPLYLKGAKVDSIKKRVIYLIEIFKKQLVVMFYNFSQGLCFIQNTNI